MKKLERFMDWISFFGLISLSIIVGVVLCFFTQSAHATNPQPNFNAICACVNSWHSDLGGAGAVINTDCAPLVCGGLTSNPPGNTGFPNGTAFGYECDFQSGGTCGAREYICDDPQNFYFTRSGGTPECLFIPSCPSGQVWNETTEQCEVDCTWPEVFDPISGTCELYDDCPVGEVPDPSTPFQCIPDICQAGQSDQIWFGAYWVQKASDINVSVPPVLCIGGCEANTSGSEIVEITPGGGCGYINGETVCGSPAGFNLAVSAIQTGNTCSLGTQQPDCPTCLEQPPGAPDPVGGESETPPEPPMDPDGDVTETETEVDNEIGRAHV